MDGTNHEEGVRLSEAHRYYCRPDLLERFDNAGAGAGWSENRLRVISSGSSPREAPRSAAVPAYIAAENAAKTDLVTKLIDDRLIARGFVIGPDGGDPDASPGRIPKDVLGARNLRIDWQKETISGNGLIYARVRLYSPYETTESVASLVGKSLAECYQLVVVDDWVRQEMEAPIFRRFPDWKIRPNSYNFLPAHHWPVQFETWSDPAYLVMVHNHPVPPIYSDRPVPPEAVVAVRKRIEQRVRHLIEWLRDGTLMADGIEEPKNHKLKREPISPEWWRQKGVELNHADNSLWNTVDRKEVRVFSDIRIVAPSAHVPSPAHTKPPGQNPSVSTPKSGSGALEVWNYLQQWKEREPEFHKGLSKSAIARILGKQPQFARYMPQSLETYVRRAFRDPNF